MSIQMSIHLGRRERTRRAHGVLQRSSRRLLLSGYQSPLVSLSAIANILALSRLLTNNSLRDRQSQCRKRPLALPEGYARHRREDIGNAKYPRYAKPQSEFPADLYWKLGFQLLKPEFREQLHHLVAFVVVYQNGNLCEQLEADTSRHLSVAAVNDVHQDQKCFRIPVVSVDGVGAIGRDGRRFPPRTV